MSTTSIRQKQKGFTIIEVVLVLAIAALIFLIVFLALPQLQKSRRDTQRKNDVGRILSAMETFSGNSQGDYPTLAQANGTLTTNYLSTLKDPSTGSPYSFQTTAPASLGQVQYNTSASCNNDGTMSTGTGNARQIAVAIKLESGQYCQANN